MRRLAPQTLPAVMKLLHRPVQGHSCHAFSSKAFDHGSHVMPKYNHGLPGKGKGTKRRGKGDHPPVQTEGETVFGVHPVTLALSSSLRPRLHTLYMDRKYKGRSQSAPTFHQSPDTFHQSPDTFHQSPDTFHQSPDTFHQSPDTFHQSPDTFHHIHQLAVSRQVAVQYVPKNTLTQLSGNRPHQGVCLDASPRLLPQCDIEHLLQGAALKPNALWLLLYNVQDPMNCGAILRSSYYLGVDRVILPKANSCPLSPVVSKASAGAMEVMDVVCVDGGYRCLSHLTQVWQSHGGRVVGTTSADSGGRLVHRLQDFTMSAATLLIVGNEGCGIDTDVVELCDTLLTIPPPPSHHSHPAVTSLNVSVATGILIHWLRSATSAQ